MKPLIKSFLLLFIIVMATSCVSKKQLLSVQSELDMANTKLGKCGEDLHKYLNEVSACNQEKSNLKTKLKLRQEQIDDLKAQLADAKNFRDQQLDQVKDLTVLTQSANNNIEKTLQQLEQRDKYIHLLQAAKTKADSVNLALAVNLKGVLKDGLADNDVEIKVDKTVVFINLSDKMLYHSGSSKLTPRAEEVLGKIAKIIESKPDLEVMVEGYTDNVSIKTSCIKDNWDLSVKRATAVVRVLQNKYNIDPNKLIAAGRGEYNTLASNDTAAGRAINRRTRIIIMPKLNQFYDLLDPDKAGK